MPTLSEQAKEILRDAFQRYMDEHADEIATMPPHHYGAYAVQVRREVAKLYDCLPWHVANFDNPEFEFKPLTARRIIRAHLAHEEARRRGEVLERLPESERYKGGRRR